MATPYGGGYSTFTDALSRLRTQKAAISGRGPSKSEVAGVIEAQARTADERLARKQELNQQEEMIRLQKESQAESKRQFEEKLAFDAETKEMQRQAAREAQKPTIGSVVGSAGSGAAAGAMIGSVIPGLGTGIGAAVGGVVGAVSGGSWICSEVHKHEKWKLSEQKALIKLMKWAYVHQKEEFMQYQKHGPEIIKRVTEPLALKEKFLVPIVDLVQEGKMKEAYLIYRSFTRKLAKELMPEAYEEYKEAVNG